MSKKIYCIFLLVCSALLTFGQSKPNVIFILADDLGYGDLSCYGSEQIQTPAIDQLAKNGVIFSRAYANSTVCSPSRAAILTGNYPDRVGVPGVVRDMPHNTWGNFADDEEKLPQALDKLGYHSALIGKWHLGYESPDLPLDAGFNYFKGFVGDMMDDYYTHLRDGVNWMRENKIEINPEGHATDLFTNWAVDYIKEQSKTEEPFFLFLTYNAPHDPVQPPKEWLKKTQQKFPDLPLKRQKIIAFIEHLDAGVEKVVQSVKDNQITNNTLIIFTSDNGGALNYGASNAPFSGGKGDMLEGGIRIPCIVNYPAEFKSHYENEPILLMDFYQTIIELGGGNVDIEKPGLSCLPLLRGEKAYKEERYMVWMRREGHRFGGKDYYAISDGTYKLLQNNPFEPYRLYNVKADSLEQEAIDNPEMYKRLMKNLTKHIQKSGKTPWQ